MAPSRVINYRRMRRCSPSSRLRKSSALLAVDLFSGCGGLTTGLKRAGFFVVGAVDNHRLSVKTYEANHAGVRVWRRDIRGLPAVEMKRKLRLRRGRLDLLAGCPPCQAFSSMRTLNGKHTLRDADKDLLFEFLRFIKAFWPKAIMIENVPGLATDKRVVKFLIALARLGYQSEVRVLDAAQYGVPQRRRRMILLASRVGPVRFGRRSGVIITVRDAIGKLSDAGDSGDPLHDFPEKRTREMKERIRKTPRDGGSRSAWPRRLRLKCHSNCDGFKDVYGRMSWGDVAPTITTGCFNPSKGRFLHPHDHRAITVREAALLQGFPKRYKFPEPHSKIALASMIGNALPPPFIAAHARRIRTTVSSHLNRLHAAAA
jgi:DNA (cytosine-5)-methyltransferase 1